MNKVYQRINWENYPDDTTPLNAQNLNRLDVAADELDNRLIAIDTVKMDKATAATMVKDIAYNEETGSFTVTYLDGSSYTLDTKLEKLAVNFTYDPAAEQLVILLDDGATQRVDLSALVTEHEFLDSDTVGFTVDETGVVRAQLRDGSVTEEKLRPDYLSDIRVESAKAQAAGAAAAENAAQAEISAKEAESYAKGGTGARPGEDTDNALYYSSLAETQADRAKAEADRAAAEILDRVMTEETAGIGRPDGVTITVDEEGVLTASVAGKTSDLENDSGFAVAAALTQEEYDALPEEKLTDGKLYLVRDAAGESGQLIRNGVYYGTDRDLRELLGTAEISAVGDGTVTGAIGELNTGIASCFQSVSDGKAAVAAALTGQGTATAGDAAFATLAANVTAAGNARYNAGVTAADNRANASSVNYKTGYNAGVTDADNRPNASSTNYKTGYNAGYSAGMTAGKTGGNLTATGYAQNAPSTAGTTFSYAQLSNSYTNTYTCPIAGIAVCVGGGSGLYHSVSASCTLNGGGVGAIHSMSIGYCVVYVWAFRVSAGSVIRLTSSVSRTNSATADCYGPSMINAIRLFTIT